MIQKAIVRKPGLDFAKGITSARLGKPDVELALEQHRAYREALQRRGIELTILEAEPGHPDGCFVEDTALVLDEAAVLLRPGAPSRQGEVARVAVELARHRDLERIEPPGTVDGGDLLRVDRHVFIGLSRRTNEAGAGQLSRILERRGYRATRVPGDAGAGGGRAASEIGRDRRG